VASVRQGASRAYACSGCAARQWGDGSMHDAEVGHSSYSSARLAASWAPRCGYDDQGELAMGIVHVGGGLAVELVAPIRWLVAPRGGRECHPTLAIGAHNQHVRRERGVGRGAWRCRRYIAPGLGLLDTAVRLPGRRRGIWERGMREMSCGCSSVRRGGESRVLQLAKTWGRTPFFPRNVGVCVVVVTQRR
jgi:hypothetical protein